MPGHLIPIHGFRTGECVLLEAALPERPTRAIGVVLMDRESDRAYFRLRPWFDDIADPDDVEVLSELEGHIRTCTAEMGAKAFLKYLDGSSNAIRITDPRTVEVDSFT